MKRFALLAALGLFLAAAPASAQLAVYGGGGSAIPTGDDLDALDVEAGLQLLGGFTYDLSERVSVYGEGQWGTHDLENSDITANPSALMGGLLVGLAGSDDAPISPYLFAGAGLQSLSLERDIGDVDDRTFGYQAGAGIGFDLGPLPTFLEGRYQAASFDPGVFGEDIPLEDFSIFSIILGFSFELGGDN
ncbi:MAG TPA: outer membrane beta-barrel protein [Longimicrobiales bacterium]|nr:outer membrane beta-barrel protein [Longimicrobiales bacterium]